MRPRSARVEPRIRPFDPGDWDAICDLYERAASVELSVSGIDPGAFRPMPDEESLDTFLRQNTAVVACIGDEVVGFAAWRDRGEWAGSGYLSWLYVDPAHHARGIGDRLLSRAMDDLGDQAWTLTKQGNDPAINLYEKHGMRIVRSSTTESSGHPHIELRLALPTSPKSDPSAPNFGG